MGWQLPADHAEALKHPLRCFQEAELKRAQVLAGSDGKLLSRSGRLSEVYQARAVSSLQRWAVKCYREEIPGLDRHYRALAEHLLHLDLPYLQPFQYADHGLCVKGRSYPLLKMVWADGIPLNVYVGENADHPSRLHRLAELWLRLAADLRRAGIAHGSLQHEHVLVHRSGQSGLAVRLVDYDAMHVPALQGNPPPETGHPNYEHPQRLWQSLHGAEADRFPHLVIYTALHCVAAGGRDLWERHDKGDNLLFRESDFQEPKRSALLRELFHSPEPAVRALVARLLMALEGNPREVPSLDVFATEAPPGLAAEQERRASVLLTGEGAARPTDRMPRQRRPEQRNQTFGILVEDEPAAADDDDNFDLIVDEDPALMPSVSVPTPLPAQPPPLPPVSVLAQFQPEALPGSGDPNVATYHLEAWMPEQVAVMKVQGFVDSATGEVVTSVPGLMRVRLLDPYDLIEPPPKPGLLAWLGFVPQGPQARVLAVLDFHMRHKETQHQKLLDITLEIRPGNEQPAPAKWRAYCDKLYCDVRAFLMGIV